MIYTANSQIQIVSVKNIKEGLKTKTDYEKK